MRSEILRLVLHVSPGVGKSGMAQLQSVASVREERVQLAGSDAINGDRLQSCLGSVVFYQEAQQQQVVEYRRSEACCSPEDHADPTRGRE